MANILIKSKTTGEVTLPAPDRLSGSYNHIDGPETQRLENGAMYIDRIRKNIRKVHLSWSSVTLAQAHTIIEALTDCKLGAGTTAWGDPNKRRTNRGAFIQMRAEDPLFGRPTVLNGWYYCGEISWTETGNKTYSISCDLTEK